jgi:hypothetical protein
MNPSSSPPASDLSGRADFFDDVVGHGRGRLVVELDVGARLQSEARALDALGEQGAPSRERHALGLDLQELRGNVAEVRG